MHILITIVNSSFAVPLLLRNKLTVSLHSYSQCRWILASSITELRAGCPTNFMPLACSLAVELVEAKAAKRGEAIYASCVPWKT